MPTLHKEMKNKASVIKTEVSGYFHSSFRGVFRTLLASKMEAFWKSG